MNRWDVYKSEVESGYLQWGSVHTEAFFKENARNLEGKDSDFKLLKVSILLFLSTYLKPFPNRYLLLSYQARTMMLQQLHAMILVNSYAIIPMAEPLLNVSGQKSSLCH